MGDEAREEGVCLFASALGINHKQLCCTGTNLNVRIKVSFQGRPQTFSRLDPGITVCVSLNRGS